jgi:phytoene synthase
MAGVAQPVMDAVRNADRDRYVAALYAPEDKRPALFALYAFHAEIAAVRDRIHEPLPGEIRLQWWRDVLAAADGTGEGHPVAAALLEAIREYRLPAETFQNYLDARVFDLYDDPMPSRVDLEGYCGETASAIIQMASLVLDAREAPRHAEAAGHAGCAQAIGHLLKLLPLHRARGQCYIPRDLLAAAGTTPEEFLSGENEAASVRAVAAMIALAKDHMAKFARHASAVPPMLRPAFLPLAVVPERLARMSRRPAMVLREPIDVPAWKNHWLLLRAASRGWPEA